MLNGKTERHVILGNILDKLFIDKTNNYLIDIIVAWPASAKKTLHNYYCCSPNQVVFSKNSHFPSVLTNKLSMLKGKTSTKIIARDVKGMHAVRKAFIEAEASEKLRRGIMAKTSFHRNGISLEIIQIK